MKVEEPALKYKFPMSPEEFLQWERGTDTKHEYIRGEVISMAGASFVHNTIVSNILGTIYPTLKGKSCQIYPSDLRVEGANKKKTYYYPDATIICGEPEFSDREKDTIKNPAVIFEVLSASTEDYDLGVKFFSYIQIPSLQQYIAITSSGIKVQSARRTPDKAWRFEEFYQPEDLLPIYPIARNLSLKDIYSSLSFPSDEE